MCERANECVSESRNFSRIGCTLRKRSMQKFMQIGTEIRERCRIIILSFNKSDTQIKPPSPVYLLCTSHEHIQPHYIQWTLPTAYSFSVQYIIYIYLASITWRIESEWGKRRNKMQNLNSNWSNINSNDVYLFIRYKNHSLPSWLEWLEVSAASNECVSNQIKSNQIESNQFEGSFWNTHAIGNWCTHAEWLANNAMTFNWQS